MGILSRSARILKAGVHGVIDDITDKQLLLKQYIRDMQDALEKKELTLQEMRISRRLLDKERDKYTHLCSRYEQDLTAAIKMGKDEIARRLIRKLKPVEHSQQALSDTIQELDRDIFQLQEVLDRQTFSYEEVKRRAAAYYQDRERGQHEDEFGFSDPERRYGRPSMKEVELELLQRKESMTPECVTRN